MKDKNNLEPSDYKTSVSGSLNGLEALEEYKRNTCIYCQYFNGKCNNENDCFIKIVEKELEKAQLWDIIEPILFHSLQINIGLGSVLINGDEYKLEKENFTLLDKALLMCIDKYKEK